MRCSKQSFRPTTSSMPATRAVSQVGSLGSLVSDHTEADRRVWSRELSPPSLGTSALRSQNSLDPATHNSSVEDRQRNDVVFDAEVGRAAQSLTLVHAPAPIATLPSRMLTSFRTSEDVNRGSKSCPRPETPSGMRSRTLRHHRNCCHLGRSTRYLNTGMCLHDKTCLRSS